MRELRVGIIGCGRMGQERARCAHANGARIVAACDPDPSRVATLTADYGADSVSGLEDLVDCDAVFLCTPPNTRPAMAMMAVERSLPFFAEKPISIDCIAAEPVLRALKSAPVVNSVGYMNRWRASIRHARRTLVGQTIIGMTAYWVNRPYRVPWWLDKNASGGPHNEQATHLFDLARHLCGEVEQVLAMGGRAADGRVEPRSVATCLRFAGGSVGTILYSCESTAKEIGVRVFTTVGSMAFSTWDFALVENTIDHTIPILVAEDVFLTETQAFLEAVRTGVPDADAADWADAVLTQRVVDAAEASLTVTLR